MKKLKRKERRKEIAEKERLEEEARLNDPEEERKRILLEQQEAERIERDRIAFEEREKAWIIKQQQQRDLEEEQQLSQRDLEQHESELEEEDVDDDDDGRPEIIWLGNEIIIQKKNPNPLLLLHNHNHNHHHHHQEQHEHHDNRPTSNPFPPESPSQPLHNVAQQPPNFGTELDKAHCPFHLKTAACRFGDRCSRVHFYPDKSCTLLIKNMYNGPGLAWEQDEGLEVCSSASVSYSYFGDGIYSIYTYFFCSFDSIIIRDIHFRGGSPFWLCLLQRKHITCFVRQ